MATIPLPALHVNPPQPQENPLDQYQRLMQLKNMQAMQPLQQQAAQQNVQSGALEVQQKQQQLTDQKAMTSAMQSWDGKDYNDILPLVIKNGGSAQAVMGLKSKILEQQQSLATAAKNNADATTANLAAAKTKGDLLDGALTPLIDPKQTPDAMLPQAIQSTAQDLAQKGVLDPQHLQQVQQLTQLPPDQIRQQLDMMRKGNLAQSQILDDAAKQAGINKDVAQTGEAQATTQKTQQEMQYGPTGPAAEAKYRFILSKKAAGQPLSQDETDFAKGFEASNAKTTTQADSLGVTSSNTSRPSGLASVGPRPVGGGGGTGGGSAPGQSASEGILDLIGQYRANPTLISRMITKHPEILNAVHQKYPDFDQTTYNAKNKLVEDYTSGKTGQTINAMNTAVGHLAALDDASQALHNGNIQVLNSIANKFGVATGSDATTTYNLIAHRVAPEVTAAYIQGGGGEGERSANANDFASNMSPQQIHNNIATSINLFKSKIEANANQYQNTVGRNDFAQRFVTPAAQAAFQKYGASGSAPQASSSLSVTAPNGKVYQFKDQASADAFKKSAGIQ